MTHDFGSNRELAYVVMSGLNLRLPGATFAMQKRCVRANGFLETFDGGLMSEMWT